MPAPAVSHTIAMWDGALRRGFIADSCGALHCMMYVKEAQAGAVDADADILEKATTIATYLPFCHYSEIPKLFIVALFMSNLKCGISTSSSTQCLTFLENAILSNL